jgi:hypothetical protein
VLTTKRKKRATLWSIVGAFVLILAALVVIHLTTSRTTSSTSAAPLGTPLPSGFAPESASFVSAQTGFVLGISQCQIDPVGGHFCLTIARTQDGGSTWSSILTPSTNLAPAPILNGSHNAVSKIEFTSVLDGYLYGPDLYATHDGGATWKRLSLQGIPSTYVVTSLGATRSNTFVIVGSPDAAVPESDYLLSSKGKEDKFAVQNEPALPAGASAQISANRYGAVISANNQKTNFYYQADASMTWTQIQATCPGGFPSNPVVALATPLSGTPTPQLVLGCGGNAGAGSEGKTIIESSDLKNFTPVPAKPPLGGILNGIASPDGKTIAVAASSGATFLYVSLNRGASWQTVLSDPNFGGSPIHDLGFVTPSQAVAVIGHATKSGARTSTFLMTRDRGLSWQEVTF